MLMDSKIYGVVEKWANRLYLSPNGESPEDDQVKVKRSSEEGNGCYNNDAGTKKSLDNSSNIPCSSETAKVDNTGTNDVKSENTDQSLIPELASTLLAEWSNLKEVFRIPKKERIEQMKEHEREAGRFPSFFRFSFFPFFLLRV